MRYILLEKSEGELENTRPKGKIEAQVDGLARQEACRFYCEFKRMPQHDDKEWLADSYDQVSRLVTRPGITKKTYWDRLRGHLAVLLDPNY